MMKKKFNSISELQEIIVNIMPVNLDEEKYRLFCLKRLIDYKGSSLNVEEIFINESVIHWLKTYYV